MAKVYLSSTYKDLHACREHVHRGLRKLGHEVHAMEDYAAKDDRPLDRCLEDVRSCDVYVGIFAWRYGFVPDDVGGRNPHARSITELEYRAAREAGKKCLIFLIQEDVPWPPREVEHGEGGERLKQLRAELWKTHSPEEFQNCADLTTRVVTAVATWAREHVVLELPPPPPRAVQSPLFREIAHHLYLACAPQDERLGADLVERLRASGRSVFLSTRALFAQTDADFLELERGVRQCHAAAVVVSDSMLDQLESRTERAASVLRVLGDRTGGVVAVCTGAKSMQRAGHWGFSALIDLSRPGDAFDTMREVERALFPELPRSSVRAVGLPFVVLAMTQEEAGELDENPDIISRDVGMRSFEQFRQLKEALGEGAASTLHQRYGPARADWKPFANSSLGVRTLMEDVTVSLNARQLPHLASRLIKAQYYRFDSLVSRPGGNPETMLLRHVYDEIGRTGCVVVIDEISLFHPSLRRAFLNSSLVNQEQVALVTVSPFDPTPSQMLENELREHLAWAFTRFETDYDPQREFGVADERRLKRWLHSSLPQTLLGLRERRPDQQAIALFRDEVDPAHGSVMADFMYSRGGLL